MMLRYCLSPRDRASIQARLGLRDPRNLRQRYLTPAITFGWLAMTDPEHPNSPVQKYRTTVEGVAYLQSEDRQA